MFKLDFTGKTVLVSGASRGIGKAIALAFHELGATVYGTATSEKGAAAITEYLGGQGCGLVMNGLEPQSVAKLYEDVEAKAGNCPDVLVNNAYVGRPLGTHFYRTQVVDFEESFRVNVAPVIQITQACIAAMRRKKSGLIITVGTLAARGLPPAGYSVYVATKAYLQQLARCWQSEYSHLGILSMTVLPDFMPTPLHGEMVDHLAEKELQGKSRLLMPEEVAQCISETISDTKLFTQERIVTVN